MISPLWWLPLAVAMLGIVPLWWQNRQAAREVTELRSSLAGLLQRVRPALEDVQADMRATRRSLEDLPRR